MGDWRGKVGALVPSSNSVFERDAMLTLPTGISLHTARMKLTHDDEEQLRGLLDHVPTAAADVVDAGVAAIAFACTTGSLAGGLGYDKRICELIEATADVPATTASTAVVEALTALEVERLVLVSPYEPWLNARVVEFLEGSGFSVAAMHGFSLTEGDAQEAVSPEQIAAVVRSLDADDVDGALISCTNFRGIEATHVLATQLDKPVVSSNGATLWRLLTLAQLPADEAAVGVLSGVPAPA
jgi:maleate isomerase